MKQPQRQALVRSRARTAVTTLRLGGVILIACVPGFALLAVAGGCVSEGARRRGVRDVYITDAGGYLEFIARQNTRDQKSRRGGSDLSTKETIFEENLNLTFDGFVYHPNLMEFALAGTFGLLQQEFDETRDGASRSSSADGQLEEFDLSADFLRKKPYPGRVYARRHRGIEARPFLPSLETTTTSYGLDWRYLSDTTPTSISLERTTSDFDAIGSSEAQRHQESTIFNFDTAYRFSQHNILSLRYSRQSIQQEPFGFNYDSNSISLGHRLAFGDSHQHSLESTLDYLDQTGTFNIDRRQWRERLRLNHTDDLRSWYDFELLDRKQGSLSGGAPIDERSVMFSGSVEHDLFDSLTSQLTAFTQHQTFGSGITVDRFGWNASLDYRKRNRLGVLRADYRFGFQRQDRKGGDQRFEVIDESRRFQDPEPIVLEASGIQVASIVITDEDRRELYLSGSDYRTRVIGERVEISRVPTGRIVDGQTVLVDYTINVGGDFVLDTVNHAFGIREEFDFGLTPYYRFRWQDQTIERDRDAGFVPEDITVHIVGAEYRWRTLTLGVEHEDHQSNISPFTALRLNAGYSHRFDYGASVGITTRWSDVQYSTELDRRTEFLTVEGRYRHPVNARLNIEGGLQYRQMTDSISGDDEGIDMDLSLEYNVRKTTWRVTYEFGTFQDDFTDNDHSALFVQIRRRF